MLQPETKSASASTVTALIFSMVIMSCFHVSVSIAAETESQAQWVIDPNQPESSLPPVGRSLFDFLLTKEENGKRVYDIPFPYERLIERLENHLQKNPTNYSPVKQVLIPLGRSLARNIARPDFFQFPRVVAAVDTQPNVVESRAQILFKDRLYVGYGEKSNLLEVISYNESAGRFEFQIVTDYRPGGTPTLFYANREVCTACHQNSALIFSRQQWDETNANPQIATMLKQQRRNFYGVPINRGMDIPFAIDAATDRANYFSVYQKLWQQACQNKLSRNKQEKSAVECRANILNSVLQYRLSGKTAFNQSNEPYARLLATINKNWKIHWPNGLLISDADIPNRNPLLNIAMAKTMNSTGNAFTTEASTVLNAMLKTNEIPNQFEPLKPRPPLAIWKHHQQKNVTQLIRGLSEFFTNTDIERIDKHLKLKAKNNHVAPTQHPLKCKLFPTAENNEVPNIKFNCSGHLTNRENKIKIRGRVYVDSMNFIKGNVSSLSILDADYFNLKLTTKKLTSSANFYSANFQLHNGELNTRLPNGKAIDNFYLQWPKALFSNKNSTNQPQPEKSFDSIAKLTSLDDYTLLKNSIHSLSLATLNNKSDALSNKPFRRTVIMASLTKSMAMPVQKWCCTDDTGMPEARLQPRGADISNLSKESNPALTPFYRNCALCHRTNQAIPPNFLFGDLAQVENNIEHCAERIFFRLNMWNLSESKRPKSPMPPYTALNKLGIDKNHWKTSNDLNQLRYHITNILTAQAGNTPDINNYIKKGFNNLRSCLP